MPDNLEPVIGLEFHTQLATATKLFCPCRVDHSASPNTRTCPICLGLPGTLPSLNRTSVLLAIKVGLALKCTINPVSVFARKNYFYPDLAKGYQITQFDRPIGRDGYLDISIAAQSLRIKIRRIHLEEDTAKMIHPPQGVTYGSRLDYNRAGTPLIEVVTDPDFREPAQAKAFMQTLRELLRYIGACEGNLELGNLRCDANISLRPQGSDELRPQVEIKNLNSYRFLELALHYEVKRQTAIYRAGNPVIREARHYDPETGTTVPMRLKETEEDYRYFNEPDLPPLILDQSWIAQAEAELPELPENMKLRFMTQYGLPEKDAAFLSSSLPLAIFFIEAARLQNPVKLSNWIKGPLTRLLKDANLTISECRITPSILAELITLLDQGSISGNQAKLILEDAFQTAESPRIIAQRNGYTQITDAPFLESLASDFLAGQADSIALYRAGNAKLLSYFVGSLMKLTNGKADPHLLTKILVSKLTPE